jgi:circadian clock protein KaiC
MKTPQSARSGAAPLKARTGIAGFDAITGGGLPQARTTLLVGGPGSGKTIMSLQFLAYGARYCREPGIFVAFEETTSRIKANAGSFGWNLGELTPKKLFFLDAQPKPDLVQSGTFDLGGLLAALGAQVDAMGATRIVLDALDIVLALLPDAVARRREVYRLHDWLMQRNLTAIITAKAGGDDASALTVQQYGFMQFMVDCAVILDHRVENGVSHRHLRVQKYRGSSFDENESAFLIGAAGMEVSVSPVLGGSSFKLKNERVSSGIQRLDTMLGGGYHRGATILITGFPGTAKTTLSGAFAEAACNRGERTLFVSFDSDANEVVRDLRSVGIGLARHVKDGRLRMASARNITGSAESYLVRIKAMAKEHKARCVVIDPMSTWSRSSNDMVHSVAERLSDWSKWDGTTLLCTSLLDEMGGQAAAGAPAQLSTLADTWIHLNYLVQAGERNRGLSIIKSRGTAHSNQVRELVLSDTGVTLADAYTAGGEVLMGTMRWEKERAALAAAEVTAVAGRLKRVRLDAEEAELEVRLKSLNVELQAKQVEKALLARTTETLRGEVTKGITRVGELRGADVAPPQRRRKSR